MSKRKSTKLGIAVVGCGTVSRGHIKSWKDHPRQVEILGLYDPVERFCRERKKLFELDSATIYDSYAQALDDDRIDIINLCSMSDVHDDQIALALEAGKHIMTEKPTGYNMEGCRRMRWYANKYPKLKVGVAYSLRYYPINVAVRKLVLSGAIGEPMWAHIEHSHPGRGRSPSAGRANRGIDSATDTGGRYIPGSDMNHSTHPYDLSRYFLGEPLEVYAVRNGSATFATVTFVNEAIAQIVGGSTSKRGLSHVTPVVIQGSEGTIYTERVTRVHGQAPMHVGYIKNSDRKGAKLRKIRAPQASMHGDRMRAANFVDALTKGTDLICDLADSVRSSELLHAMWNSYSLGIRVRIQRSGRTG